MGAGDVNERLVWLKEFKYSDLGEARAFINWLEANDVHYAWFLSRVGPRTVGGGWFYDSPLFDAGGEMTVVARCTGAWENEGEPWRVSL